MKRLLLLALLIVSIQLTSAKDGRRSFKEIRHNSIEASSKVQKSHCSTKRYQSNDLKWHDKKQAKKAKKRNKQLLKQRKKNR